MRFPVVNVLHGGELVCFVVTVLCSVFCVCLKTEIPRGWGSHSDLTKLIQPGGLNTSMMQAGHLQSREILGVSSCRQSEDVELDPPGSSKLSYCTIVLHSNYDTVHLCPLKQLHRHQNNKEVLAVVVLMPMIVDLCCSAGGGCDIQQLCTDEELQY